MPADEEAIRRTLIEYCRFLDSGAWDQFAQLFHEDAVFAVPAASTEIQGREAIRRWMAETYHWVNTGRHLVANSVIAIEGDRATVESEVVFFLVTDDGPRVGLIGRNYDVLHRTDAWRFSRRESDLDPAWMAPSMGEALADARNSSSPPSTLSPTP